MYGALVTMARGQSPIPVPLCPPEIPPVAKNYKLWGHVVRELKFGGMRWYDVNSGTDFNVRNLKRHGWYATGHVH